MLVRRLGCQIVLHRPTLKPRLQFTPDTCSRMQYPGRATCIRIKWDTCRRNENFVAVWPIYDTCRRRQAGDTNGYK